VIPTWSTACPDWEARIREGRSLMPCGPLFPAEAEAGMAVFSTLRAVGVANPDGDCDELGRPLPPTYAQVARPWIMDLAAAIHGAYNAETGERLIREVLVKVPKKNWKSGLAAGLMLSLSIRNWRESNEGAIIAPTKETADNVFKPMRDAIRADPELDALFHVQPNMRTITHRVTGMSCRVYAADTDTVAGKVWAFVIFEELWLLAKRRGAEDLMLEATGGQASRPEGVVISITTESDDEPVGIYKAKLEFARRVRDGQIEAPHFLPLLYEWPQDLLKAQAYMDPANFHLVNPNYGASVDPVDMVRKFEEAKEAGDESLRVFLAKRLNVPPSENMGGSWPGAEFWPACAEPGLTLESLLERSEVAVVGIDGGGLDDLLGLVVLGREKVTRKWLLWAKAWAHKVVLERRKAIEPKLRDLEAAGDLTIVESPGEDVVQVAAVVRQVNKAGLLPEKHAVGVDAAGIGAIVEALTDPDCGLTLDHIVAVPQGWKLNGAIKTTERAVAGRDLLHGDQPLMAWSVSNAKVTPSGNAVSITKQVSGSAKIDPLMAAFNAVTLMALNPAARRKKLVMLTLG
jgi:phage terminase large subunit-like protein